MHSKNDIKDLKVAMNYHLFPKKLHFRLERFARPIDSKTLEINVVDFK